VARKYTSLHTIADNNSDARRRCYSNMTADKHMQQTL